MGRNWQHRALSTRRDVESYWRTNPECHLGVLTGANSGLLVVDIDVKGDLDGTASVRSWEREFGNLPETLSVVTGSGGDHLYFRIPHDLRLRKCNGVWGGSVDLLADGAYVVAPPSIHPNGQPYHWANGGGFSPDLIADAPDQLVKWIRQYHSGKKSNRADGKVAKRPKACAAAKSGSVHQGRILEGTRNETLFAHARSLKSRGVSDVGTLAAIHSINETDCCPPLPDHEIVNLVDSAISYGSGESEPIIGLTPSELESTAGCELRFRFPSALAVILTVKRRMSAGDAAVKISLKQIDEDTQRARRGLFHACRLGFLMLVNKGKPGPDPNKRHSAIYALSRAWTRYDPEIPCEILRELGYKIPGAWRKCIAPDGRYNTDYCSPKTAPFPKRKAGPSQTKRPSESSQSCDGVTHHVLQVLGGGGA